MDRKAKIICTIGPATHTEEAIAQLIDAGMDVARLNFSHGSHQSHLEAMRLVRAVSERKGKTVAVLQDLQGPKIRIGSFENGCVNIVPGATFTITTRPCKGDANGVSTPYTRLPADARPGTAILLHDGLIKLEVTATDGENVTCKVVDGGMLSDRGGISLPGVRISEPSLTEKDKEDLIFGLEHGVDYVALSFVRDARDLVGIRAFIREHAAGRAHVPVVAKLETAEALDKLDAIIDQADAVMVARGDLGVEISAARVPVVQKDIIERCHKAGKPVITATQMLDSMANQPTPTRAEASDVANAVFDGSDAVMLSVETAFGKYPVKSVETMAAIIREAEKTDYFRLGHPPMRKDRLASAQSICRAAFHTADGVNARMIVCCTTTGISARLMSKYRPKAPIIALSRYPATLRRTALYWGTVPMLMDFERNVDNIIQRMVEKTSALFPLHAGDKVVITSGASLTAGGTNLLRLYTHLEEGPVDVHNPDEVEPQPWMGHDG
ncbi:MAG: pyruvate kinase [Nitrospirae bacterium]|nr:pyruvate kinase [Nitrospirota bacterium]